MNILVVDIAAEYGGALSVLTDFYNFVKSDKIANKHHWIFVVSTTKLQPFDNITIETVSKGRFPWISRVLFDNLKIRRISKKYHPDIILSLQNTLIRGIGDLTQAVYIHQSLPFQKEKVFSFFKKSEFVYAIYQHIIGAFISRSAKKANKVFVQTQWMKRRLTERTGCESNKIEVVPINRETTNTKATNIEWNNKSFFFPAFYAIYKNQDLIYGAAKLLEAKGVADITISLTTQQGFDSSLIKEGGRLSHNQVLEMMQSSTLIFPSYIETVGLPLIEAMAARTVILAADCEYAHETLGDYPNAYYFDPFEPASLANLIEKVANGKIEKKTISITQESEANNWVKLLKGILNT